MGVQLIAGKIVPSLGGGARAGMHPTLADCSRPDTLALFRHQLPWFGGHHVTVVGQEGYVLSGHLYRFGKLGYVKA